MIEGFGQQESAGPFGRSKWPLSYCLKHVKGASRTQIGSDCSRASWGAPKAADLGFELGLQLWGRPVLVKSRPEKFPLPGFGSPGAEARRPSISQQDSVTTTACGCCWRAAATRPRSGEFPEGCLLEMGVFKGSRFKQTFKKARE